MAAGSFAASLAQLTGLGAQRKLPRAARLSHTSSPTDQETAQTQLLPHLDSLKSQTEIRNYLDVRTTCRGPAARAANHALPSSPTRTRHDAATFLLHSRCLHQDPQHRRSQTPTSRSAFPRPRPGLPPHPVKAGRTPLPPLALLQPPPARPRKTVNDLRTSNESSRRLRRAGRCTSRRRRRTWTDGAA